MGQAAFRAAVLWLWFLCIAALGNQAEVSTDSPKAAAGEVDAAEAVTAAPKQPPSKTALRSLREGEVLDLNKASASELALLPGIGPKLSQRIVDYRTAHGPFKNLAALRRVSGIGPVTVQRITSLLKVEDQR